MAKYKFVKVNDIDYDEWLISSYPDYDYDDPYYDEEDILNFIDEDEINYTKAEETIYAYNINEFQKNEILSKIDEINKDLKEELKVYINENTYDIEIIFDAYEFTSDFISKYGKIQINSIDIKRNYFITNFSIIIDTKKLFKELFEKYPTKKDLDITRDFLEFEGKYFSEKYPEQD